MSVCDMSLKNRYTSVDDHLPTHPEAIINKNPNDTEKRIQKKGGVTYMRNLSRLLSGITQGGEWSA